jgi:hypothetical protein
LAEGAILCLRCFVPPACLGRFEARVLVVLGFLADARTTIDGPRLPSDHPTGIFISLFVFLNRFTFAEIGPRCARVTSTQAHSLFVFPCCPSFSDLFFRRFRLGIGIDVDARLASGPLRNYIARSRPRPSGWLYHSARLSAYGCLACTWLWLSDLAHLLNLAWLDPCGSGLGTCLRFLSS